VTSAPTRSILVTGGFGFIGSHLVELLLKEPETRVHVVDNLVTSPIDLQAYLEQVGYRERLTYDIRTVSEYFSRDDLPAFDEVYHLASVVGPVGVLKHAGRILQAIVDDMYSVIGYAHRAGARLCDVSTSEVYGGGRDGYCSEKDSKIIPPKISVRLEYAIAKLGTEVALTNLTKVSDFHATIVRPFNVAGPRQACEGGFVLPRFIKQALAGEPLTVYGDGSMIRAFTHVLDIADGVIRAMRHGCKGEAYNIGNPANKITILDLAERVLQTVGGKSEITFVDPKLLWGPLFEEANDKYPDADRAVTELNWRPKYDLDEIIQQSVEYIRQERRA
jgi:nucleoside-diphosphate-sugar epimerase